MIGSYREWLRQQNVNVSTTVAVATGNAGPVVLIAPPSKPKYAIFVQRITVQVLTTAAVTGTFQDTNSSPVVIAGIPASQPVGPELPYNFLDEGTQLTPGKGLNLVLSGAGYGLLIAVEAYMRIPVGTACVPADL